MSQTEVEKFTSTDEGMRLFQQEGLILEVTELIYKLMEEKKISKADLSKKLDTGKGHITQLLDGTRNMTLRTISDFMWALGCSMHVAAEPLNIESRPAQIIKEASEDWGFSTIKLNDNEFQFDNLCGTTNPRYKKAV